MNATVKRFGLGVVVLAGVGWSHGSVPPLRQHSPDRVAGPVPMIGPQFKEVPFRATQVIVRRGANGVVETRGRIARNSAGSTYVELIDEATKAPMEALIFDVPNRRELVLDLRNRRYRTLSLPSLQGEDVPINSVAELLRGAMVGKDRSVSEIRNGVVLTRKGLGVRRLGGLEAVGSVEMRRPLTAPGEATDAPTEVDESWVSVDLGIAVLRTRHDPLRGEDTDVALTEVLRVEPDAALFEVPSGFVMDDGTATLLRPAAH